MLTVVVFVREVEDPRSFGVVAPDDDGFITRFVEKPESMANWKAVLGLYWIRDLERVVRCIESAIVGPCANVVAGTTIRNAVLRDSIIDADAVIEDVILEGFLVGEKARGKGQPKRLNIGH